MWRCHIGVSWWVEIVYVSHLGVMVGRECGGVTVGMSWWVVSVDVSHWGVMVGSECGCVTLGCHDGSSVWRWHIGVSWWVVSVEVSHCWCHCGC